MCSLVLMISLTACNKVVLHPLDGVHIQDVNEGESFTAPIDGYFLSNDYFKKVLKAKVEGF